MVKKIMHDPLFLAQKSVDATEADKQIVTDLFDTLRANLEHCVGMAANMIGVKKNIIVIFFFYVKNTIYKKKRNTIKYPSICQKEVIYCKKRMVLKNPRCHSQRKKYTYCHRC